MSALELHAEILDRLDRSGGTGCAEVLKRETKSLIEILATAREDESRLSNERARELRDAILEETSEPSERLLAVSLLGIEYETAHLLSVLPRCLAHVASSSALVRRRVGFRDQCAVAVIGRLVWALATFALHCDRPDVLALLSRATAADPELGQPRVRVLSAVALRYPDALGGNAQEAYNCYRDWLHRISIITEGHFLLAAELDLAFDEADFVLALIATDRRGVEVYSAGFTTHSVERFRTRLHDPGQRPSVARLFGIEAAPDSELERRYGLLRFNQNRFDRPPANLFATEE